MKTIIKTKPNVPTIQFLSRCIFITYIMTDKIIDAIPSNKPLLSINLRTGNVCVSIIIGFIVNDKLVNKYIKTLQFIPTKVGILLIFDENHIPRKWCSESICNKSLKI